MVATEMCRPGGKLALVSALAAALMAAPLLAAQSNSNQPAQPAASPASPQAAPPAAPGSPRKMQIQSESPADQQAPAASPVAPPPFEVATIKASKPDPERSMLMFTEDGISVAGFQLDKLMREAFNTEDDHIIGEPSWVKSSKFDIEAKVAPEDAPKLKGMPFAQRKAMLLELLVDRFGLKYHHETRELPLYELVVAKGGLKMQLAKAQDPENTRHMMMFGGPGKIESTAMKVTALTHTLSGQLGRTVVDKTGLTGEYDFTLTWTPDEPQPGMSQSNDGPPAANPDAGNNPTGPSLFTALEEQLGLKLESSKGPEEVIVIDHIEQPSAN
jgi:bla regulator protein blaR1